MKMIKPSDEVASQKIKLPSTVNVFLGGSIEQVAAEDWQAQLATDLDIFDDNLTLWNPRRDTTGPPLGIVRLNHAVNSIIKSNGNSIG